MAESKIPLGTFEELGIEEEIKQLREHDGKLVAAVELLKKLHSELAEDIGKRQNDIRDLWAIIATKAGVSEDDRMSISRNDNKLYKIVTEQ